MIFFNLISSLLNEHDAFQHIWFAGDFHTPPKFSYQVNFPRLELVLYGEYLNEIENERKQRTQIIAKTGDAIFIPPNCWNKPDWNSNCSVLSILFGRKQIGFSFVSKRQQDRHFYDLQKDSIQTRSGFAMDNILAALGSLAKEKNKKPMDELLIQALLQYTKSILASRLNNEQQSRVQDLYQRICIYIQENFNRSLTRDNIAGRFSISANHLSRLFRNQGHMTLADYITWVRIDRAKFMLKRYDFKLPEVAARCGFNDVNYFCRVFKIRTGNTPSEYRDSL